MKSETKEKIRAIIIKKYGRSPFPPRNPEEAKRRGWRIKSNPTSKETT